MFNKIVQLLVVCLISFSITNAFAECIEGDCVNGTGTFVYPSGNKYLGQWKKGKFHGDGMAIGVDGKVVEGKFVNGKIDNNKIFRSKKAEVSRASSDVIFPVGTGIAPSGPKPLHLVIQEMGKLKGMSVSWSKDIDKEVLVYVLIWPEDDFFEAINNVLRQLDYTHEMEGNTIVVKHRDTKKSDNNKVKKSPLSNHLSLPVGARIAPSEPKPLWLVIHEMAKLKRMSVGWSKDIDKEALVHVLIMPEEDFFEAIDNVLRQLDYTHEMEGNTIVIKHKETKKI